VSSFGSLEPPPLFSNVHGQAGGHYLNSLSIPFTPPPFMICPFLTRVFFFQTSSLVPFLAFSSLDLFSDLFYFPRFSCQTQTPVSRNPLISSHPFAFQKYQSGRSSPTPPPRPLSRFIPAGNGRISRESQSMTTPGWGRHPKGPPPVRLVPIYSPLAMKCRLGKFSGPLWTSFLLP